MTHQRAIMAYNQETDCWMVQLGGRAFGLHCGEHFMLCFGDKYIPCRLEMDWHWYITMNGTRLNLRNQDTYKIKI